MQATKNKPGPKSKATTAKELASQDRKQMVLSASWTLGLAPVRRDMVRCDMMRYDAIRCDAVQYGAVQNGAKRCDMVRCDVMRYLLLTTYYLLLTSTLTQISFANKRRSQAPPHHY